MTGRGRYQRTTPPTGLPPRVPRDVCVCVCGWGWVGGVYQRTGFRSNLGTPRTLSCLDVRTADCVGDITADYWHGVRSVNETSTRIDRRSVCAECALQSTVVSRPDLAALPHIAAKLGVCRVRERHGGHGHGGPGRLVSAGLAARRLLAVPSTPIAPRCSQEPAVGSAMDCAARRPELLRWPRSPRC